MKYLLIAILFLAHPALAVDQQAYLECKEDAFKALVARYKEHFNKETGVNATQTVTKYDQDFERAGKDNCEKKYITGKPEDRDQAAYLKCLDGAINAGTNRLSRNLVKDLGISSNADALEKVQNYQADYVAADEKCRARFLGEGDSCVQKSKAAVDACSSAKTTAITACDPTQDAGLLNVQRNSDSISTSSGSGVQNSCQAANQQATNANSALANYKSNCSNAKQTCTSQCAQARQTMADCSKSTAGANAETSGDYQSTATNGDTCSTLEVKVQQAEQAVQTYSTTKTAATNCQNDTNGNASGGSGDGAGSGAGGSGSSGSAASASTGTNDMAKANSFSAGSSSYTDPSAYQGGGGVQTSSAASTSYDSDSLGRAASGIPNFNSNTGAASSVGGKQGNSVNFGSGGSFGGPAISAAGASKETGAAANAYALYAGANGTSGGGGGGAYGGGRGIASGEDANAAAYRSAKQAGRGDPDLRAFLPGGIYDPKRRMGGMGGGPDGITGPNSNIWQKVQNRYRVMSVTLLP